MKITQILETAGYFCEDTTITALQAKGDIMKANKEWIQKKLDEGYTIIDIGEGSKKLQKSDFYEMEKLEIQEFLNKKGRK